MQFDEIKNLLDEKYYEFNTLAFIEEDPIFVPHQFQKKEDIEISGFIAATLAWGQRNQIIKHALHLMQWMDLDPYNFILNANNKDLKGFKKFIYRTFNGEDCEFFIRSLKNIYKSYGSIENIFNESYQTEPDLKNGIIRFRKIFFETHHLQRSEKHFANPLKNSACKRINLFLRWMIRSDNRGVDFGIWKKIPASALYCPLDIHTGNTARELGLLTIKQNNWKAVCELTENLKKFDPYDPVKYDFSLFGLGFYNNLSKFDVSI